jgi:trimeric autotransporter adhesin
MRMVGPTIHLPAASIQSPRLSFMHYVASEFTFDGGNLKISVNGGPFVLIPRSAFIFNAYNADMAPAPGNTDPLAGQPAFTGSDGGQVTGSWGQSQVDLTKAGVQPGDTIRLAFDFGMDGCTKLDGWYVDDIKVQACNTKKQAGGRSVETTGAPPLPQATRPDPG